MKNSNVSVVGQNGAINVQDGDNKAKPYLQGWAMVENPTDEDWAGVKMALVSGRPISFKMDLYNPLFVPRPTVASCK